MAATEVTTYHSLPLLNHLSRVGSREADAALLPTGLKPRHLVALMLLDGQGAVTQQHLAEALSLDPSNVVGLLNELESSALVSRRRDPADRRRHIVEITADGKVCMLAAQCCIASAEDRLLRALSPQERKTLHTLLVKASGNASLPHPCKS